MYKVITKLPIQMYEEFIIYIRDNTFLVFLCIQIYNIKCRSNKLSSYLQLKFDKYNKLLKIQFDSFITYIYEINIINIIVSNKIHFKY